MNTQHPNENIAYFNYSRKFPLAPLQSISFPNYRQVFLRCSSSDGNSYCLWTVNNRSIYRVLTRQALCIYGIPFNSHVKGWYQPHQSMGDNRVGKNRKTKKLITQGHITTEWWDRLESRISELEFLMLNYTVSTQMLRSSLLIQNTF